MKTTQCDHILRWLKEIGPITPIDALREFSCMRLAARCDDLKKLGFTIDTEMVKGVNKFGDNTRFARYTLREEVHVEATSVKTCEDRSSCNQVAPQDGCPHSSEAFEQSRFL